ncbi:MAG: AAA family ATPase, partial [Proteobacteria bacterium]|nr:AAA family ATPase [Pseudomonadota bacterium]
MTTTVPALDCRPHRVKQEGEAWRDLDRTLARWVLAHGGPDSIATAAAWASFADGRGDAALMLDENSATRLGIAGAPALRMELSRLADDSACGWVARVTTDGSGHEVIGATPFALDGDAFYLRRNLLHEIAVARHLRARLAAGTTGYSLLGDAEVAQLFAHAASAEDAAQREAVRRAPGRRLFVLTGGPGTGKTTTVLRMLLAMTQLHASRHGHAPTIRLAAPTGKAAQRLGESLRLGGEALRKHLLPRWLPLLEAAQASSADTVHRLLEPRGTHGFARHSGNRLQADIVVVDEASMLDLALLRALLDALPDECALVLVGDADQLASVDTGSVLADVVTALDGTDALVRLHHSFRAQRELAAINAAVQAGSRRDFDTAWSQAGS